MVGSSAPDATGGGEAIGDAVHSVAALPRTVADKVESAAGGPARLKVILLLSAVLALTGADQTVIGAVAPALKPAIGLSNTEMGVLVSATGLAAAVTILPFGVLADRTRRIRLLVAGLIVCVAAVAVAGASGSFLIMLFAMIALGVGIGSVNPAIASLTGDLFPAAARGRIYGYILAGEIGGGAAGLLLSEEVAAWWSWRASFWVVALPGAVLAVAIARMLPEPARGGQSRLPAGAREILPAEEADPDAPPVEPEGEDGRLAGDGGGSAGNGGDESSGSGGDETADDGDPPHGDGRGGPDGDAGDGASPDPDRDADGGRSLPSEIAESPVQAAASRVLRQDPAGRSLWWAVRYVLSVPTNVVLIVASALGYFFFAGLQTFAVVFLRSRFALGQGVAGLLLIGIGSGALLGILTTGRLADKLIARHHLAARPVVAGIAFLLAAGLFLPGLLSTSLAVAFPFFFLAAAAVGGMNPPIDAARRDITHSRQWGRAEGARTFLQTLLKSAAPVLLGYLSEVFGGAAASGPGAGSGGAADEAAQNPAAGQGLAYALTLMLIPLAIAGVLLLTIGRRCYPTDVATAMESEQAVRAGRQDGPSR
jgi:MFS family permease